ncbi:MAG: SgcJ/EcaC family oxidoreductase [Pseudonocardiaceae bacterium]
MNDDAAVRALFDQTLDAWNRGDGAAFAAPFTDPVDFIAFDGTHLTSREQIVTVHQELFDKWLKGTRLTGDISVRFLSPDVALLIAHGGTIMRGKNEPAPERESIQTFTAVRQDDGWGLTSFQNTRIRPIGRGVWGTLLWLINDKLWALLFGVSRRSFS